MKQKKSLNSASLMKVSHPELLRLILFNRNSIVKCLLASFIILFLCIPRKGQAQCSVNGGTYTLTTNTTCPTFSLSNGATYNINPGVTLTVNGTTTITGGVLNVNGNLNVTTGGMAISSGVFVNFNSPSNSSVSCSPTPGCTAINNLSGFNIAAGAALTTYGDVASNNGGDNIIDGTMTINGAFTATGGSTVTGAGTFTSTGSMSTSGGASIFGNTTFSCPSNCTGHNSCTGFAASITTPSMNICSGSSQTLNADAVAGATYQWERSTSSSFSSKTNLTTTQNYGPVSVSSTYFFRRRTTLSGCSEYTNVVKLTIACPTITTSGTLSALSTIYGTPSSTTSFTVSGSNLNQGITIVAPAGFEVSTSSGSGFANSIIAGSAPTVTSLPIYVRLASTAPVGTYSGNIQLSSLQAATVSVATVSSTVSKKALTITGITGVNKVYNGNTTATITGTPALSGVVNSDVVTLGGTPSFVFANAIVGTGKAITASGYTISGAGSGNYTLTQPAGLTANITPAPLTITASNVNKVYGNTVSGGSGSTSFTTSGLVAGETIGSVTIAYGTGSAATAAVGAYSSVTPSAATGGTFSPSNYAITYANGTLNVTPSALTITANNASKCFNTTHTFIGNEFTSSGLKNADAITSVTLTSTGTASSATVAGSPYNIVPSAATGTGLSNYTITYANGLLTVKPLPTVTTPSDQTRCNGIVTSSVTLSGSSVASTTYNWTNNNTSVGLAASGSNTVPSFTATNTGTSSVTATVTITPVANGCSGTPVTYNYIVNPQVVITSSPAAKTVCSGTTTTLTGSATGANLTYQWRRWGIDINNSTIYSGVQNPTLTLTGVTSSEAGEYSLYVSSSCGSAITANALLSVNSAPVIANHPVSANTCDGGNTLFETYATGGGLIYQWKENGVNINNGGIYSGANSSALILTNVTSAFHNKTYSVEVSNGCSPAALSNSATLTVTNNVYPSVGIVGSVNNVCPETPVNFTAYPTNGGTTPSYQWKVNGVNVGSNSDTYSSSSLANNDVVTAVLTSSLTCVVTPTATSNAYTMIVYSRPAANITSPNTTICTTKSTSITGNITASGAWTLTLSDGSTLTGNGSGAFSKTVSPSSTTTYSLASLSDAHCVAGTSNLSGSTAVTVNPLDYTWTGSVSTDWLDNQNWSCNTYPSSPTVDVVIPNTSKRPCNRNRSNSERPKYNRQQPNSYFDIFRYSGTLW